MKQITTIIKWLVGILFIFSGLIKANDPLGLSYKMDEFFEAWHFYALNGFSLLFAVLMNLFEVGLGVALIIGSKSKTVTRLLLALITFFLFLTSYVLFSGKIKTCGCFGDCLPLTPIQTFLKDVILFILIIWLVIFHKYIQPALSALMALFLFGASLFGTMYLQKWVLRNLPILDCLPFAIGKNILAEMQVPQNATPDIYDFVFEYKKNGKLFTFTTQQLPNDLDSSYVFVDRKQILIQKGHNELPVISDFTLQTSSGIDTAQTVLSSSKEYILLFLNDLPVSVRLRRQVNDSLLLFLKNKDFPVLIVSSQPQGNLVQSVVNHYGFPLLTCDATTFKTVARTVPTYLLIHQATIIFKCSYTNANKIFRYVK
ncbi:MAG: hypothetical protein QM528_00700 [Phycisphaerales bacterium]|nr:hypothetical protein [Phycisphaerales bacterium]